VKDYVNEYLGLGWNLIPIRPGTKKPAVEWGERVASPMTAEELRTHGDCGLAVLTGAPSGVIVLDVDGPEGEASIEGYPLPDAPTVRTARGRHLYFRHPGRRVKSRTGVMPKVDVRGDGGYAVLPPTLHELGVVTYTWTRPVGAGPLPDAPSWLLELCEEEVPRFVRECSHDEEVDTVRVQSALQFVSSSEYQDWKTIGMALHHAYDGDAEGFALWSEWSQGCSTLSTESEMQQWLTI